MPVLGLPAIMAPAIGVLVGGLGQVAAQWPLLRREGFRYAPLLDFSRPGPARGAGADGAGRRSAWRRCRSTCSSTPSSPRARATGAVSWLNYAFRLMYLPIGLFGVSIATAALPSLSRHAARDDLGEMRRTISHGLRLMLMLNVPATVGLVALATPIVGADLRARPLHARGHRRDGGGAGVLRAGADRLLGGQDRGAVVLRAPRQPHARDGVDRDGAASTSCSTSRWRESWATRAWRSARRSPRCSTRGTLLVDPPTPAGRPRRPARSRRRSRKIAVASLVMGGAAWGDGPR